MGEKSGRCRKKVEESRKGINGHSSGLNEEGQWSYPTGAVT